MLRSLKLCRRSAKNTQILSCKATGTVAATKQNEALPFSEIPKLPTIPFLGSGWVYFPLIGKYDFWKLHKASLKKYEEYGPIYREDFSSSFSVVNITDVEDICKLFRAEGRNPERRTMFSIKKYRQKRKDVFNNGGLLTTQGTEWYQVRSEVQPHMMKPKSIHTYLGGMDDVVGKFIERILFLRKENGGEVPNFLDELYKWALESVGLVALDTRLGCLEINPNPEAIEMIEVVNKLLEQIAKLEFSSFNLWKIFPTPVYRKFERNMNYFTDTVHKYIIEANNRLKTASKDHEATFLELMISTTKDPKNINGTIADMFFGGIDTTSSTVGFTLYHLARNPNAQETLHQEVSAMLKGKDLGVDDLNNMRYLKACVKESMRLSPVVVNNARTLQEDVVLSGYSIPAGTVILTHGYAVGLMEKYFPEPMLYRPERFLRDAKTHDAFAYIPFGFGPRSCIGRRIAEQEIWTLLTRIIQRFRVEYHHEDIDLVTRLVSIPDKPLRFNFFDR